MAGITVASLTTVTTNADDIIPVIRNGAWVKMIASGFANANATTESLASLTASVSARATTTDFNAHTANVSNPHGVTKTQLGLNLVDNTSDAGKPISTAAQTALDLKAPIANPTFTGTVSGINKTMIGLSNVDNVADTNKPISTATQAALDTLDSDIDSLAITTASNDQVLLDAATNLSNHTGVLVPTKVGPFTIDNVNYATLDLAIQYINSKFSAQGATAPVISTAPASADTTPSPGQTGISITAGTYTGTQPTSKTWTIDINNAGSLTFTVSSASYDVPSTAAGLPLKIIENAVWSGGVVTNTSATYTVLATSGVPVVSTLPSITPTIANESSLLSIVRGAYTNDDGTLTYTQRWTTDWTLTGSLTAATSANFTANWLGTTGTYTVIFSDGTTKSTTLTNSSTSFSWTGAVTATSAVKVQVATTTTLQLNANNVGHAMRLYETPTNSVGTGSESEASNTVTPVATATGVAWTGLTGTQWTNITDRAAITGDTLASGAQAAIAAIPTTGGVTLSAGEDIRAALASNSRVFLSAGNYTITSGGYLNCINKELIGVAGATVNVNLVNCTSSTRYVAVYAQNSKIVNIRFDNAPSACINDDGSSLIYQVLVDHSGNQTSQIGEGNGINCAGSGSRIISCEARHGFSHAAGNMNAGVYGGTAGGDSDGLRARGGSNFWADVWAVENSDDGFDFWNATGSQHLYYCGARKNGKNSLFTGSSQQGNGHGYKYGQGSVAHYNNWPVTDDNLKYGHNYNTNTVKPVIKAPSNSGDDLGPYAWGAGEPAAHYTIVA